MLNVRFTSMALRNRRQCSEVASSKSDLLGLANITKAWFSPLNKKSDFVKPYRFHYIQNNVERNWDLIKMHDGLITIIYNKERQKLVFVRQFRPALYHAIITSETKLYPEKKTCVDLIKYPPTLGISLELCAGLADKDKSPNEIISEEVLEECGYNVPAKEFERIITYRSGIGATCAKQTVFFCEVNDEQRVSCGGGINDEVIEVVELTLAEASKLVQDGAEINCPPATVVGMMWFFANKAPSC